MKAREEGPRLARWWANRSIRTKGLVVVAVPIVILLAVVASTAWFAHLDDSAQAAGTSGRQGLADCNLLNSRVLAAEDAASSYLLTGNQAFLRSYRTLEGTSPSLLSQLAQLSVNTPQESASYPAVASSTDHMIATLSTLVAMPPATASSGSSSVGGQLSSTQAAGQQFDRAVGNLEKGFTADSTQQRHTIHISYIYLLAITIGAAVLAVIGGIAATQLFTSGVTRRLRRLERATAELEEGGLPQDVPAGDDEIGRVSQRLVATAAELQDRAEQRDRARRELEHILTASPVVSLRYDVAGRRFSYASPNLDRLLGISAEEAVANPSSVIERFHPEDSERLQHALIEAFSRAESAASKSSPSDAGSPGAVAANRVDMTLRFLRDPKTGEWGQAEAIYTLELDESKRLSGVVAYLVDASQRHAAQRAADERTSMLETIFHASPDTIVVRDTLGRVILASSTLADVIGVGDASASNGDASAADGADAAEAAPVEIGGSVSGRQTGILSEEDRQLLESLPARCLSGDFAPEPVITTSRFRGDTSRTFETRARPVVNAQGEVIGTVTVSRDITFRMRLEESLREASNQTARASEAKSEFLSRMSHELRTPLNAILGFAQLLELDDLSGEQVSSIEQIERAGKHLLSLINEVLDISRIEAGKLSLALEPVNVGEVLDEVATLLAPAAETAALQLAVTTDGARQLRVQADRQRLLQVLLNLGSNALKYNERGGSVAFRTSAVDDRRVRFEVRDTGPGIPPEQQAQLFVPFSRLGAERTGVEGTGVGLALSKQLVELMGGSIGVESLPGRGSTFWVELVREPDRERDVGEPEVLDGFGSADSGLDEAMPAAAGSNGGRGTLQEGPAAGVPPDAEMVVLQIEDNPSNASLVEQVLSRRPAVRVVTSSEANLGLALARQYRPRLVLLDLHLPDMHGEDLLYRLKAVPELETSKIVVLSADATPGRIRRMLELGVDGYLTKPVDVEALLGLVDLELAAAPRPG